MKQKKNFRESNLWSLLSLYASLNSKSYFMIITKRYTVSMYVKLFYNFF
jgi:hypothetical protein